jgi:hypothetical protein
MEAAGKRRSALAEITNIEAGTLKKRQYDHYTVSLAIEESAKKMKIRSEKAKKASAAMHAKYGLGKQPEESLSNVMDDVIYETPILNNKLGKAMAAKRRTTLHYLFVHVLGSPAEDVWLRDGVVLGLMKKCDIPAGSSESVKVVLRDIVQAEARGEDYDISAGCKKRGRHALIVDLTPQATVVYHALELGSSTTQTAVIVNKWRAG